jgi:plastocyanin
MFLNNGCLTWSEVGNMKKILALFLILFLIGCSTEIIEVTPEEVGITVTPTDNPEPTDTAPTEPEPTPEPEPETNQTTEPEETITSHTILIEDDEFDPDRLTIAVGDTVTWKNNRESGKLAKAFIIGSRGVCKAMKSEMLEPGEEFSYTFEEAGSCTYVDGIITILYGRITVE